MHHNKLNFSIMPTTGSMNKLKGAIYFNKNSIRYEKDKRHESACGRLDTFVYCLNEFLTNKNELIFACSTLTNKRCLQEYLNTFNGSIYDYCKKIYFVDKNEFVDKLVENGSKPIKNANDLDQYMNLAINYWKIKECYINSNLFNGSLEQSAVNQYSSA